MESVAVEPGCWVALQPVTSSVSSSARHSRRFFNFVLFLPDAPGGNGGAAAGGKNPPRTGWFPFLAKATPPRCFFFRRKSALKVQFSLYHGAKMPVNGKPGKAGKRVACGVLDSRARRVYPDCEEVSWFDLSFCGGGMYNGRGSSGKGHRGQGGRNDAKARSDSCDGDGCQRGPGHSGVQGLIPFPACCRCRKASGSRQFPAHAELVSGKLFKFFCIFVGLSNILDSKGREDIPGSSPVKRTHGAGVASTLVCS